MARLRRHLISTIIIAVAEAGSELEGVGANYQGNSSAAAWWSDYLANESQRYASTPGEALNAVVQLAAAQLSADYSHQEAIDFAFLAQSAFCPSIAQAWDCGPCQQVPGVESVRVSDDFDLSAHAYVGRRGGQCVIAFRGTDVDRAWIQDLRSLALADLEGCSFGGDACQVGRGFLEDYRALAPKIKGNLEAIGCSRTSPLAVTGHSLGGALATLALFDLAQSGYNVVKGYTFGQPRVGDSAFAGAFGELLASVPVIRVTKSDDPVPLLPPQEPFQHIGQQVYFKGRAPAQFCNGAEDGSCANAQRRNWFWLTMKCVLFKRTCGHKTYFPPQLPFETPCQKGSSILFP